LVGGVSGKPLLIVIIDAEGWKRVHDRRGLLSVDSYNPVEITVDFYADRDTRGCSGSGWRRNTP
jgi:hypothetical protein